MGRGGAPSGVRNDWVLNDNTSDRSVHEKGQMYKMYKKIWDAEQALRREERGEKQPVLTWTQHRPFPS